MCRSLASSVRKFPEKFKDHTHCPICHVKYFDINCIDPNDKNGSVEYSSRQDKISRDHILPKVRMTDDFRKLTNIGQIRNIVYMCSRCNSERGDNNHCLAAMILKRLINDDDRFYRRL